MSGTHESDRALSHMTFYTNACKIEEKVHDQLPGKAVPKRKALYLGLPTARIAGEMVDWLEEADGFVPTNMSNWEERRKCLVRARACCWKLKRRVQLIINKGGEAPPKAFEELSDMLDEEIAMLTERYKNCKLVRVKESELPDKLADAEGNAAYYIREARRIREYMSPQDGEWV